MLLLLVSCFPLPGFLFAQSDTTQQVPRTDYYPDGKIKKTFRENKRKSVHKVFYQNGKLKFTRKVFFKANIKISTAYFDNGRVKSKLEQKPDKNGKITGTWKYYGADGRQESQQTLEDGVIISTEHFRDHTTITETGEYKIEIIYKTGKWKGRGGNFTRMYDKNGNLINETPLDETQRL